MGFDVKITTFLNVLDLVAPLTCRGCGALGGVLCECCKNYNISTSFGVCARCREKFCDCKCDVPVSVVGYREGVLMRVVEEYKYQSVRAAAETLAELMAKALTEISTETVPFQQAEEIIIVPLPTISKHIRERGFDHTKLLAKRLAKELTKKPDGALAKKSNEALAEKSVGKAMTRFENVKVEQILMRNNNAVQVGSSGVQRKKQAETAYKIAKKYENGVDAGKFYLLVDDVWTTGASMEAATHVLKTAGAKQIAAAVLLMPRDDDRPDKS